MLRLAFKVLLAAAAVAAVWCFVPVGGRTLAERWRHARTPAEFVERAWGELRAGPRGEHAPARPPPPARARGAAPDQRPSEAHSEADRRELDRIVTDHLPRSPGR